MIRTTDDGDLRVVIIDRPARQDVLRPTDLGALKIAVTGADAPVVLLRGSGLAFRADADLNSVTDFDDPETFAKHGQRVVDAVELAEPVVVVGVDGAARGGGVGFAFACNVQVVTPRTTFDEPGVRLDLFDAWDGTVRLSHVVGESHILEFSLSGHVVNADEAFRVGLVSRTADNPGEVTVLMTDSDHRSLRIVKGRLRGRGNQDGRLEQEVAGFAELHRANIDDIAVSHGK